MHTLEFAPHKLELLLSRAGVGDSRALSELHGLSSRRLHAFAMRIVRSRQAAEDVVQESFIVIWRDAAKFDAERAAPMTWMMTIVRNKAIDSLRATLRRERITGQGPVEALIGATDPAAGPYEMMERAQSSRQVRRGLTLLGVLPRQAIELAFFDEMTHDEVALRMTQPLGTVKTWIRRGCMQMRTHMERPAPGSHCYPKMVFSKENSAA
jgi:RNA polymerase sigma-70 factor (ECF subfamily)